MPPRTSISPALEEKISTLLSQMAVTNNTLTSIITEVQKLSSVVYGSDVSGGIVTNVNMTQQAIQKHEDSLSRLEKSCEKVSQFMEGQLEINKAQSQTTQNLNRVVRGLAAAVVLILILIAAADIHALELLLKNLGL